MVLRLPSGTSPSFPTLGFLREVVNDTAAWVRIEARLGDGWATIAPNLEPGQHWRAGLWLPRGSSVRALDATTNKELGALGEIGDFAAIRLVGSRSQGGKRKRKADQ